MKKQTKCFSKNHIAAIHQCCCQYNAGHFRGADNRTKHQQPVYRQQRWHSHAVWRIGSERSGYAYLSYNGVMAVLLNRPGMTSTTPFGDTSAGLTQTLSGTALYIGVSPLSSYTSFTTPGTSTSLSDNSLYGGMDPNGTWTLFFADVSGGGGDATLRGWSLDITAVPEPVNVAMAVFGAAFVIIGGVRSYRQHANLSPPLD